MDHRIYETKVYSGKTIPKSSEAITSVWDIIDSDPQKLDDGSQAEANPESVEWFEVRGHSTAFYFGNSDHADKDTQAAYLPFYRAGKNAMRSMFLRAVADAAITGVVIEVAYSKPDLS